jgi:hypothetical protein
LREKYRHNQPKNLDEADQLFMTAQHPDFDDEQAYIDHAYDCLERSREDALKLHLIDIYGKR